jgi:hypothetical protein
MQNSFFILVVQRLTTNGFGAYAVRFEKSPVCTPNLYLKIQMFSFCFKQIKSPEGAKAKQKNYRVARIAELPRVST